MNSFIYQHPMLLIVSSIQVYFNLLIYRWIKDMWEGPPGLVVQKRYNQLVPCFQALGLFCLCPGS